MSGCMCLRHNERGLPLLPRACLKMVELMGSVRERRKKVDSGRKEGEGGRGMEEG